MKKSLRLISLVLVSLMLFALMPISASAASVLDGKKILFFGDSITQLGGSNRYTALLTSMYPNSTIINAGVAGNSTYNARLRFDNDVIAKDPDVVFICFGMNDQAIQTDGTPIKSKERYRTNIQNFITALHDIGAEVVLMTPHPVCLESETGRTDPNYRKGDLAGYCDILRELAVKNNCGLVDMYTEFYLNYNSATYIYDGLHLTAAGHQVYANCISAYLDAVYNNTNKATLTVNYVTENGNKIGSRDYVGAAGANIKLLVPEIAGFQAISTDLTTTLATKTIEFTYSSKLEDVLAEAEMVKYSDYGEEVLSEIRSNYKAGIAALESGNGDGETMAAIADRLEYLLTVKGENELVYTTGLDYTTSPAPNYFYGGSDTRFVDDGVRLADGSKSNSDGSNNNGSFYSVWQGTNVDITFDYGKEISLDTFSGYFAEGVDGVSRPDGISVSYSADGNSYKTVSGVSKTTLVSDTGTWDTYKITLTANEPVSARYIKITVKTVTWGSKCAWMDEIEAALSVKPADGAIGIEKIYTQGSVAPAGENIVIAEKIEDGYIVTKLGLWEETEISEGSIAVEVDSIDNISLENLLSFCGANPETGELELASYLTSAEYEVVPSPEVPGESSEPVEEESSEPIDEASSEPIEDETSEPMEENSDSDENESSEPIEGETSEPIEDDPSEPVEDETSGPIEDTTVEPDVSDDKSGDASDEVSDDSSDDNSDESFDDNSNPDNNGEEPGEIKLGDINGNGTTDSLDYILLKRAFFNTFALNDTQSKAGDINGNGAIDSLDYILLKRAYFGTYKL